MEIQRRILVLQEDSKIGKIIKGYLNNHHIVFEATSIYKAKTILQERQIDLVILNTKSREDTISFCEYIKSNFDAKVFFVSSNGDIRIKEMCFKKGADDFLVMPFIPKELEFRAQRLIYPYECECLDINGLTLNTKEQILIFNKNKVFLSKTEYLIINYLMKIHKPVTAECIAKHLYHYKDKDITNGAVVVGIKRLRNKLNKSLGMEIIKNRYGQGYYLSF